MDDLFKFVAFTQKFQKVLRKEIVPGEERNENDAEHSYQLALVAMYIIEKEKLQFDLKKVLAFAIVHDLVETYAGETYIFDDQLKIQDKHKREIQALEQIKKEFPEFNSLGALIEEYEKRESDEAKFIYALDKLLPLINIVLDNVRIWHRLNITHDMIFNNKDAKIRTSPEIEKIWNEFAPYMKKNKEKLFVG